MTVDVRWRGPIEALSEDDRNELMARASSLPEAVREEARAILAEVEAGRDEALAALTERFDGVRPEAVLVPPEALDEAHRAAPKEFLDDLRAAIKQVRRYHEAMARERAARFNSRGISAYERHVPLGTVGIYVPGGRAAYPSTVVMTVVPAQVAGVRRLVVASPPGGDGLPHPLVLAACHELGIKEVAAIGGAQAVFALALGTESVPRCQAVVGPGNVYVQAAKELIAGRARIDAPAGPSEVAVLVDEGADPTVAALELAAQAEHDPAALAVAVCLGDATEDLVHEAFSRVLDKLARSETVAAAMAARGALVTAGSLDEAVAFLDELAPEHCVLLHPDGPQLAKRLTGPACIVAGPQARVALTDYVAGPSHVLPTGGSARAYSGIGLDTFIKRIHVVVIDGVDKGLVGSAARLARLEGLDAHARAIEGCWR